jgi:nicotinate-nucleotide adenylyltransferase
MNIDPAVRTWRKILIYGGTFDPPHRGHVVLPRQVRHAVNADGVLYIPAGQPPHKDQPETPARHRIAMLQLVLDGLADTAICRYEVSRPGPSYTVDTLEFLRSRLGPRVTLRLLIGADMALIFDKWYRADRVADLAEPLVMLRPPHDQADFLRRMARQMGAAAAERWAQRIVAVDAIDISSTQLRRELAGGRGQPMVGRGWLDPRVWAYIRAHGLYVDSA